MTTHTSKIDSNKEPWKHRLWHAVKRATDGGWPKTVISRQIGAGRGAVYAFLTEGTMGPQRLHALERWLIDNRYLAEHDDPPTPMPQMVNENPPPQYRAASGPMLRDSLDRDPHGNVQLAPLPTGPLRQLEVCDEPLWKVLIRLGQPGLEMGKRLSEIDEQREAVNEELEAIEKEWSNILRRVQDMEVSRRQREAHPPDIGPPKDPPEPGI